jgi:hypothetical protein
LPETSRRVIRNPRCLFGHEGCKVPER